MKRRIPIFWLVTSAFLVFLAVIVARQWVIMNGQLEEYLGTSRQYAITNAQVVSQMILDDVVAGDWDKVQATLTSFARLGVSNQFQVVDQAGEILADSHVAVPSGKREISGLERSFFENQAKSIPYGQYGELIIAPLAESGALPKALLLYQVNLQTGYEALRSELLIRLLWTLGLGLVLMAGLMLLLWRTVLVPVRKLRQMAESGLEAGGLPPEIARTPRNAFRCSVGVECHGGRATDRARGFHHLPNPDELQVPGAYTLAVVGAVFVSLKAVVRPIGRGA